MNIMLWQFYDMKTCIAYEHTQRLEEMAQDN